MGVVLLASLTLLPWHTGGASPTAGGGSGRTALQAPGAALGVAAAIVAAAIVGWLAVAILLTPPRIRHPGDALLALAAVELGLVVLELAADVHALAVGAWASVVLAAGLVALRLYDRRSRVSRPL